MPAGDDECIPKAGLLSGSMMTHGGEIRIDNSAGANHETAAACEGSEKEYGQSGHGGSEEDMGLQGISHSFFHRVSCLQNRGVRVA